MRPDEAAKILQDWWVMGDTVLAWAAAEWDREHPEEGKIPRPYPEPYEGPIHASETVRAAMEMASDDTKMAWAYRMLALHGALRLSRGQGDPPKGDGLFGHLIAACAEQALDNVRTVLLEEGDERWSN